MISVTKMEKHWVNIKKWLVFFNKPFIRFLFFIATVLLLVVSAFFLYHVNPEDNPLVPSCSFYHFTHLYCPGCGMTRALHAVMHGHFALAFSFNLLWPFLLFFVATTISLWLRYLWTGKSPFERVNLFLQKYPSFGWLVLIVLLLFWIGRNILLYPFTLLAPG